VDHSPSGRDLHAELEDLDVGAVLAFAERTLCDLAGSWNRAELQQKQRLQSIIFPSGVTWDGEAVRTRETARVFGWIDPICDDKERLVTPSTRSWNQLSAFIEEWDELRRAA
jgi:hypothetical protein